MKLSYISSGKQLNAASGYHANSGALQSLHQVWAQSKDSANVCCSTILLKTLKAWSEDLTFKCKHLWESSELISGHFKRDYMTQISHLGSQEGGKLKVGCHEGNLKETKNMFCLVHKLA